MSVFVRDVMDLKHQRVEGQIDGQGWVLSLCCMMFALLWQRELNSS